MSGPPVEWFAGYAYGALATLATYIRAGRFFA
jgi:hypothetical protein